MADESWLVIGIDYGTTYTGVAYATPSKTRAILGEIDIVKNWGTKMSEMYKVPSVISYSTASRAQEQQWGASLSPDAIAMINTKLELDLQDNKSEELDLILQALEGMDDLNFEHVKMSKGYPSYTWKGPEDIVADYLEKVFQCVPAALNLPTEYLDRIPVDIVVTVPVKWSYRAQNATFVAVKRAGFNTTAFPKLRDIIMVTEPEAAAICAARCLKEDAGREFLKRGESFVLCDAGGGTVDVVSYKVKQLEPTLELEKVTFPTGAKCGSVYIDGAFKNWLRKLIKDENYRELDPRNASQKISSHAIEGKEMRELMTGFDKIKRAFSKEIPDMKIDLPEPLDSLSTGYQVVDGELTVTNANMRSFFDPCIDQIVELVKGQISQVERKGSRVRNIFLVGGFGESIYLQKELELSLRLRQIQLRRPDTSWTAVVRGAVIHGIEKSVHKNLTIMKSCPRNYGILLNQSYSGVRHPKRADCYIDPLTSRTMAASQMTWLIRKGDLLLSSQLKEGEERVTFKFSEEGSRKFSLAVYQYPDDDPPSQFKIAHAELNLVVNLTCDFSEFPLHLFSRAKTSGWGKGGDYYYWAECKCRMEIMNGMLTIQVLWNERLIAAHKVDCE